VSGSGCFTAHFPRKIDLLECAGICPHCYFGEMANRTRTKRQFRWAAGLLLAQGILMEGVVALGVLVLLATGVTQGVITSRAHIFALPYLQENLYLMMAMSGIFAALRVTGAVCGELRRHHDSDDLSPAGRHCRWRPVGGGACLDASRMARAEWRRVTASTAELRTPGDSLVSRHWSDRGSFTRHLSRRVLSTCRLVL
jgi:hypothetical protein